MISSKNNITSALLTRLSLAGLLTLSLQAEYILKNGTILQDASVKQSGEAFTATIIINGTPQAINFTANDLRQINVPEPSSIDEAKLLIASGKAEDAIDLMQKAQLEQATLKAVPGSYWSEVTELLVDALVQSKKTSEIESQLRDSQLSGLQAVDRQYLKDYASIFSSRDSEIDTRLTNLKDFAKTASSGRLAARAWLEVGDTLSEKGRLDEALNAWLRVTVFHQAEEDLSLRALISASRAMQQINRHNDGKNLLTQYVKDHVVSSYVDLVKNELLKFEVKKKEDEKTTPSAPAPTSN